MVTGPEREVKSARILNTRHGLASEIVSVLAESARRVDEKNRVDVNVTQRMKRTILDQAPCTIVCPARGSPSSCCCVGGPGTDRILTLNAAILRSDCSKGPSDSSSASLLQQWSHA